MTTKTKQILDQLAKGGQTFQDLVETLGIDEPHMRQLIGYLQKRRYIETVPSAYRLTEEGVRRHGFKPKSSPSRIARNHLRNQAERAKRNAIKRDGIVAHSIRTQPNSVFQLGAQA